MFFYLLNNSFNKYVKLSNMIFYTLVLPKFKLLRQLVLTACPALFSIVALSFLRRSVWSGWFKALLFNSGIGCLWVLIIPRVQPLPSLLMIKQCGFNHHWPQHRDSYYQNIHSWILVIMGAIWLSLSDLSESERVFSLRDDE